ncbi:MAG: SPFH domain-containing protein [Kofleriaceae bacterium]|jgi:regulator of protease activity HflC (stomatin/prohibitin superfamily)|nr:SPFH domain-containing protein [Kofleriaceae bacterium]MBP9168522.1 SPFH domain-containing protein [Kofleriaceae bacterium]MBP9859735.1 SPFH domain-containing protein [Kofleriaceae bacterium]
MSGPVLLVAGLAMVGWWIAVPVALAILRALGVYIVVQERQALVYTLFGKVAAVYDEPGLTSLWPKMGVKALLVPLLGKRYELDLRIDQTYLRSQPVNSEEGAPMGIGVWYEMFISDPVSYLFKNQDPRGSLHANVSNATVRCLSNMKLARLLEDRHELSQTVRAEVSPRSQDWGFKVGSIYIRKVHFRDAGMTHQIEEKVVNRLRQVTSAIRQDGANQVSVITSSADRTAAVEFARAGAIRPEIVGAELRQIASDREIATAMFEVLEVQRLVASPARVTLLPPAGATDRGQLVAQLAARTTS